MGETFRIDERVRWSDVDAAGIICYGAYTRFLELAETELFRAAGFPYGTAFRALDIWLPRVHMSMDFLRPAYLDDLLQVHAWVARLGRSSVRLEFRVEKEGTALMRGRLVLASVSRGGMEPVGLPRALAEALRPYLHDAPRPDDPREALLLDLELLLGATRQEPASAIELALDVIASRLKASWIAVHVLRHGELTLEQSRGVAHDGFLDVAIERGGREIGRLAIGGVADLDAAFLSRLSTLLAPLVAP